MIRDEIAAVPLWINGHAYLTVPPAFHDVIAPNGEPLRRTPLCTVAQLEPAIKAASAALAAWQQLGRDARAARIVALAPLLAGYAEHFECLIAEESGCDLASAAAEVERTLALLAAVAGDAPAAVAASSGPLLVVAAVGEPLFAPLALAIPALLAGATLLLRPAPQTPSALFAFAELTGRCAFPPGVVNVVHGGDDVACALAAQCERTPPA